MDVDTDESGLAKQAMDQLQDTWRQFWLWSPGQQLPARAKDGGATNTGTIKPQWWDKHLQQDLRLLNIVHAPQLHQKLVQWFDEFLVEIVAKKTVISSISPDKHVLLQQQDVLDAEALGHQKDEADVGKWYDKRVAEWTTGLASMIAIHPFVKHWGSTLRFKQPKSTTYAKTDRTLQFVVANHESQQSPTYKELSDATKEMIRDLSQKKQNIGCWEHKSVRAAPVGELIMILHEAWREGDFNWTECAGPSVEISGCKKHLTTEPNTMSEPINIDIARTIVGPTVQKTNLEMDGFHQRIDVSLHNGGSCLQKIVHTHLKVKQVDQEESQPRLHIDTLVEKMENSTEDLHPWESIGRVLGEGGSSAGPSTTIVVAKAIRTKAKRRKKPIVFPVITDPVIHFHAAWNS
jgi:hypothetical protein